MPYLGNRPVAVDGDTNSIDTTQVHPVGTAAFDKEGNEYIYCKGVASCLAGSWVTLDEVYQMTLTVADAKGRVGVAMAAIIASRWGWVQIYGKNTIALAAAAIADDAILYLHATAGQVDDAVVAGDLILGAIARSAVGGAGVFIAELNYPFVDDSAVK